jgi:predicted RNA binding protein YcfA (HicA-like mRNA interferase family)
MTARELMGKLKANGWTLDRIKGSHHIFVKDGHRNVAIPVHGNKDIWPFAKVILKQAGIIE